MKRIYYLIYPLMIVFCHLPFIPTSIKGIFGFLIIMWSCMKLGLHAALFTAAICAASIAIGEFIEGNLFTPKGILIKILVLIMYFLTAYYFGKHSDQLKASNEELKNEIEKREKVEKELNDKLGQLQSLMDTIPNPICFKDTNGSYRGCNRAFAEFVGISETEITGKNTDDLFDRSVSEVCKKAIEDILSGSGRQTFEETVRFSDGSLRNVIFNKDMFLDKNQNPAGIVVVMTDITVQKETEQLKLGIIDSKRRMEEMLENDKIKTEFFSNISHEFRTPLNVILGSLQLMELYLTVNQYAVSREKVIKKVAVLKQNSFRLLRLVNNLIDISRIDAKAIEMHFRNCDIVGLIRNITLSVAAYTGNEGITVTFETDIESKIMACDDDKIERILLNLLSNAIKFTPKGGRISVRISEKPDGLCIIVEDNGVGIPAEKQNQIFRRFCQIDRIYTRQHEGSGIGLNLVKSLVEMHGGTITFASQVGFGTSFMIFLPHNDIDEEAMKYNVIKEQAYTDKLTVEFSDIYSIGRG